MEPIKILDDIENNRDEFLKLRSKYIGASDIPVILGLSPWSTPFQLWAEKTCKVEPTADNDELWYGREHEALVAKLFSRRFQADVSRVNAVYRHPTIEWLTCSPDYFYCDEDLDVTKLLECKTAKMYARKLWSDEKAPDGPHCQLIGQMAVMGIHQGRCGVIIGGSMKDSYFPEFEYDNMLFTDFILPALEKFKEQVDSNTPPDVMAGDYDSIDEIYKTEKKSSIYFNDHITLARLEFVKIANAELKTANAAVATIEKARDLLKAKLRMAMGTHEFGETDQYTLTLRTKPRKGYVVEASSYTEFKITEKAVQEVQDDGE